MLRYNNYMKPTQPVDIFKALADETRLAIVRKVAASNEPTPGCELPGACLQQLSQPAMSHHITRLVEAGILSEEKSGTKKAYTLRRDILAEAGIDVTKL